MSIGTWTEIFLEEIWKLIKNNAITKWAGGFLKKYWISYALIYVLLIVGWLSSILKGSQIIQSTNSLTFGDILFNYPFGLTVILCFYKALGERKPNFNEIVRIYVKIVLWELGLIIFPIWAFFAIKKIYKQKTGQDNSCEDSIVLDDINLEDEDSIVLDEINLEDEDMP